MAHEVALARSEKNEELSLVELLDTLIDKGVVLAGDAVISVSGVDLVYLGLRLVLASVNRLEENGQQGTGDR